MTTQRIVDLSDVPSMLAQMRGLINQIEARIAEVQGVTQDMPRLSASELAQVDKVGKVASRHLSFLEKFGQLTLGDSLTIRRELYPNNVQATANLFGTKESNSILYRVDHEKPRNDVDEVRLSAHGVRMAELWRQLHPEDTFRY